MSADVKTAKTELRRTLRLRQSALSEDYVHAASDRIQDLVLSSSAYREAQSICLYLHMPYEPATDRILRQALADGKTVYVPKCVSRTEMLAVRIRDLSGMKPGAFGIPEPADITETRAAADLDLILVPCLSAAPDGRRLGHGAGYYDRFLAGAGLTGRAVCLCFRRMLCGEIPADDYDIRIPQIITE